MKKLKLNVLCFFVSKTLKKVYTQLRCNNYVFFFPLDSIIGVSIGSIWINVCNLDSHWSTRAYLSKQVYLLGPSNILFAEATLASRLQFSVDTARNFTNISSASREMEAKEPRIAVADAERWGGDRILRERRRRLLEATAASRVRHSRTADAKSVGGQATQQGVAAWNGRSLNCQSGVNHL